MATALHQCKVIRDTVVALLVGKTAAESRVVASRKNAYKKNELPAISVYTLEETVDRESRNTAPRELTRDLKVEIAGWVFHAPDGSLVDDAMDALKLEIETVMYADPFLGGAAGDSLLEGTVWGLRNEGDVPMGLVVLTYSVTYRTLAPEAPDIDSLDDFITADTLYQPPGVPADGEVAHDTILVQESP